MKTNEILIALNIKKATVSQKSHCKSLSELFAMVRDLKDQVINVVIEAKDFYFGQKSSYSSRYYGRPQERYIDIEGDKLPGEKWTIETLTGTYKISLPTQNSFYSSFCDLLPQFAPKVNNLISDRANLELLFTGEILEQIKRSIPFASIGKYSWDRISMQNIKLEMSAQKIKIVATDGYRIITAELVDSFNDHEGEILLPAKELKTALNGKKDLIVCLFKTGEVFTKGTLNGVQFDYLDSDQRYPAYNNVIPTYSDFVEVNRKELIRGIKQVLPYANRVTHQVNLHVNGSILLNTEDMDFLSECNCDITYEQKTTPDFDLSFNGKYLLDCLAANSSKTVKMYTDGITSRPALFDNVLLMPIVPH